MISVAYEEVIEPEDDTKEKPFYKLSVRDVVEEYFPNNSKIIYIGDGKKERGFLSTALESCEEIYNDTSEIIEGT